MLSFESDGRTWQPETFGSLDWWRTDDSWRCCDGQRLSDQGLSGHREAEPLHNGLPMTTLKLPKGRS